MIWQTSGSIKKNEFLTVSYLAIPIGIPVSGPVHSERDMRVGKFCHYVIIIILHS